MAASILCLRVYHSYVTAKGHTLPIFLLNRLIKQSSRTFSTSKGLFHKEPSPNDDKMAGQTLQSSSRLQQNSQANHYFTSTPDRLGHLMQMYEDIVGLTEVKQAQDKVVNAEQKFLQVQEDRRAMQQELLTVQVEVRAVGAELEKTSRTDSRYIDLVKKEHEILLIEKEMTNKIKTLDKAERDFFSLLSAALRESHEKERGRAEKTKYWSIIGSIIGAIIGIVGSTFNNMKRMKELRAIVTESGESAVEYKALVNNMLETVHSQHAKIEEFVHNISNTKNIDSSEHKLIEPLFVNNKDLKEHTQSVLHVIEEQSQMLQNHLQNIQNLVAVQTASESDSGNIVYVGPKLEEMLQRTEQRLQNDLKKNSWVTTTAVVGIMTLGVSVIIFILQGQS